MLSSREIPVCVERATGLHAVLPILLPDSVRLFEIRIQARLHRFIATRCCGQLKAVMGLVGAAGEHQNSRERGASHFNSGSHSIAPEPVLTTATRLAAAKPTQLQHGFNSGARYYDWK